MKTAEERIVEYCNQVGISVDAFKASLTRLIKEQDRDTRHACAEAVIGLPWEVLRTSFSANDAVVSRDDAHDACMNVKEC